MADEVKEVPAAVSTPAPTPAPTSTPIPAPKAKAKSEKVKVKLYGAGSCNYEGIILRKNEIVELEASQVEQFMKSGLFEKL